MGKYIYEAVLHPDEEGGYWVTVPDLPGCVTEGETVEEAAFMAADAMKTYVASLLMDGRRLPKATFGADVEDGGLAIAVFFETDENYIVSGEVMSAAQASRELGVSPGRVTHMIDAGILEGYREGRRTYVTVESVERRKADDPKAGRPKKAAMA
ncbi:MULTISPECIES: type II toxin-antitoxin system HicB family antitoxin [Gordonibacter]|uniref:Type II toxin-antitoxin system HicB family antitoxin n=1 Tax=Gordonibacter faecis TaxID=3047475 RepID=A0ABT7DQ22_9ACTN|nr:MULTISPECIES: type II toxin-antitoxin system HicB family antitoxin [unclassified Gordonibacter]MDJ1651641.1 type II toxin-antitoxin system HicB family antitoxin [Gordonibacter sp. KGMB12511]HIW77064.1 type II toxin-antitoxin system HicB family antitoxin [Candidatus Gordonibacter avicola]